MAVVSLSFPEMNPLKTHKDRDYNDTYITESIYSVR